MDSIALDRRVLADWLPRGALIDAAVVTTGALLMALLAQIAIPVPPSPVPITGQTLGVVLCGGALGSKRALSAMLLYLALGLFAPVYAEGGSGMEVLTGPSGGYLLGFVLAAFAIGRMAELGGSRQVPMAFVSFCVGQLLIFGIGVPWLKVSTGMEWSAAIHDGFTIFIFGGLVKAAVAALLLPAAWSFVAWRRGL